MVRIFIISKHLMFSHGLESLLLQESGLEILDRQADAAQAVEQVKTLKPDVVILDSSDILRDSAPLVMSILAVSPKTKVIGLSLQDNQLHIYRVSQWMANSVEDLVQAIKNGPAPAKPTRRQNRSSEQHSLTQ